MEGLGDMVRLVVGTKASLEPVHFQPALCTMRSGSGRCKVGSAHTEQKV